jgi:hypothetical protein
MAKKPPKKPPAAKAAPAAPKTPFVQLPREERSRIKIDEQKAANKALAQKAAATKTLFPPPTPAPPKPPTKLATAWNVAKDFGKRNKKVGVVLGVLGAAGVGLDYTKNSEYKTAAPAAKTNPPAAPAKAPKDTKRKSKLGTSTRPK